MSRTHRQNAQGCLEKGYNKQIKSLASLAGTQTWRLCRFAPIIAAMFAPLSGVLGFKDESLRIAVFLILAYFAFGALFIRYALPYFLCPPNSVTQPTQEIRSFSLGSSQMQVIARSYGVQGKPCLFFFPGQHGGVSRYENELVSSPAFDTFNISMFSYPSQDGASGSVSSLEKLNDFLVRLALLTESKNSCSKLYIYGRSLGAMVALSVSSSLNVDGIILEGASESLVSALKIKFKKNWYLSPYQILPIKLLLKRNFELEKLILEQKAENILLVQGTADKVTPLKPIQSIAKRNHVDILEVENGNHESTLILAREQVGKTLKQWANRH